MTASFTIRPARTSDVAEIRRLVKPLADKRVLLANEKAWREERAQLIEKNEMARHKVESMISRLKALEQD